MTAFRSRLSTADSVFDSREFSGFVSYAKEKTEGSKDGGIAGVLAVTKYIDDEKPLYVEMKQNGIILNLSDDGGYVH